MDRKQTIMSELNKMADWYTPTARVEINELSEWYKNAGSPKKNELKEKEDIIRFERLEWLGEAPNGFNAKAARLWLALKEAKREEHLIKQIKINEDEDDYREMSESDYRQVQHRRDAIHHAYLNNLNKTLIDIQLLLMALAEKERINVEEVLNTGNYKASNKPKQ